MDLVLQLPREIREGWYRLAMIWTILLLSTLLAKLDPDFARCAELRGAAEREECEEKAFERRRRRAIAKDREFPADAKDCAGTPVSVAQRCQDELAQVKEEERKSGKGLQGPLDAENMNGLALEAYLGVSSVLDLEVGAAVAYLERIHGGQGFSFASRNVWELVAARAIGRHPGILGQVVYSNQSLPSYKFGIAAFRSDTAEGIPFVVVGFGLGPMFMDLRLGYASRSRRPVAALALTVARGVLGYR